MDSFLPNTPINVNQITEISEYLKHLKNTQNNLEKDVSYYQKLPSGLLSEPLVPVVKIFQPNILSSRFNVLFCFFVFLCYKFNTLKYFGCEGIQAAMIEPYDYFKQEVIKVDVKFRQRRLIQGQSIHYTMEENEPYQKAGRIRPELFGRIKLIPPIVEHSKVMEGRDLCSTMFSDVTVPPSPSNLSYDKFVCLFFDDGYETYQPI
jgi:hypothetical protein